MMTRGMLCRLAQLTLRPSLDSLKNTDSLFYTTYFLLRLANNLEYTNFL